MRSSLPVLALVLLAAPAGAGGPRPAFTPADPTHAWTFPRDHFARPGYRNEWWYFTGILDAPGGRRLGYQLTFFKVGLLPEAPASP